MTEQTQGREQLLFSHELQTRVGQKFCDEANLQPLMRVHFTGPELLARLGQTFSDETELLALLLEHDLVCRVQTIEIDVWPLSGDSFGVTLDASQPTVGEAKAEIARVQGIEEARQEMYMVRSADGGTENDAEPRALGDDTLTLSDGDVVAIAVKEPPLLWRSFAQDRVRLSEDGAVATQVSGSWSLTTSEIELTEGRHYWEVELVSEMLQYILVGVSRPNLDPRRGHYRSECTDGWFMHTGGTLFGNGKYNADRAGCYTQGDRVGVLLDLDDGSLRFFKNGAEHGPGYPAGSVTGSVVHAIHLCKRGGDASVRLLPSAELPLDVD
jgi:hypothetical protein